MNTSTTKESLSNDPIDKLIFEQGVRIKQVWIDKELDLLAVLLTNRKILKRSISEFKLLQGASESDLKEMEWDGVSIHWPKLDEDLSLRGLIKYELVGMELTGLQK